MKNKKGFTLTEVIIVIVIIGVLISISIPSITAIRKKMNIRLFEEKKKEILTAAELYAKDKGITTDTMIKVYNLLDEKYLKKDVSPNSTNCSGNHTANGCIINPVDDTSLNEKNILLKVSVKSITAIWEGTLTISDATGLIDTIKDKLNCTSVTESKPCMYNKDNPDNYLYYSGIMWRILGVYSIDGKEVAKLISDDNVTWEISA